MDQRLAPAETQKACQQRSCRGTVDVVVAKDRDLLAARHRVGDAFRGRHHVGQVERIRHQAPDARVEKGLDLIERDAAAGNDARQQVGNAVALSNRGRECAAAIAEPVAPSPPGRRMFHAEEIPVRLG
jgi:hypothetical protein